MGFKFEDYINGNMPEPERRALEQRLANDPTLQDQLKEEEALLARLKRQMLRERVEAAMKTGGGASQRRQGSRWGIWAALVIVLALLLAWWTFDRPVPDTSGAEPAQERPSATVREAEESAPAEEPPAGSAPAGPVAQHTVPPQERPEPQSGLRGVGHTTAGNPAEDAVRQFQLPGTAAGFAPAFRPALGWARQGQYRKAEEALAALELQGMAGDTLAYLRAFCLLKQEKGIEAARYFARLETPGRPFAEEAQWGLALSWFLAGQEAWAEEQLQAIISQPEHSRAAAAEVLLEKLAADQQ